MNKETQAVGASYVVVLYQDIQDLNESSAVYSNLIREFDYKLTVKSPIEEVERAQLIQYSQNVAILCTKTYYKLRSLMQSVKTLDPKDLDEKYNSLMKLNIEKKEGETKLLIEVEKLSSYVFFINKVLLNEMVQTILQSVQETLNQIYE